MTSLRLLKSTPAFAGMARGVDVFWDIGNCSIICAVLLAIVAKKHMRRGARYTASMCVIPPPGPAALQPSFVTLQRHPPPAAGFGGVGLVPAEEAPGVAAGGDQGVAVAVLRGPPAGMAGDAVGAADGGHPCGIDKATGERITPSESGANPNRP